MRLKLILTALAGLVVFTATAVAMTSGATDAFDKSLFMLFRPATRPGELLGGVGALKAMVGLTNLGGTVALTVISLGVGAWLLARRERALTVYLAVTMIVGTAIRYGLKAGFARARPDSELHQVSVDTFSFPSSHAMMSTICYLTLGGFALRLGPARWRPAALAMMVGLPVAIGISRVYLGVHWPSDVVAGWSAGIAWAALCAWGYEAWRARRAA